MINGMVHTHSVKIAPSILAADFTQLGNQIKSVPDADLFHVDIMDGHFVPNISFGFDIVAQVNQVTDKPLDLHLMIDNPEKWVDKCIDSGADIVIFHVEATDDHVALAKHIRSRGVRAAFSLRPGTPLEPYLKDLEHFDQVLVMSVEPGFGGQGFMPDQLDKVRLLRKTVDEKNLDLTIEIDGGINTETIAAAADAGCDVFVAGSAVFGKPDPNAAIQELRKLATR